MNADEYGKMYQLEDHYWWFVGRRNLALALLQTGLSTCPHKPLVVDLGCGTGVVLRELSTWSEPVGLDMSRLALSFCRQRGLSCLVQGDGTTLPFADGSVDAIIGLDIFEHIQNHEAAFKEAQRILKPGGILVLSVPAFQFLWGPHDVALMHFRRYRKASVHAVLSKAGFTICRLSYSVFFLFPVIVLWRMLEKRRKGPAHASLVQLPGPLNRALITLQSWETALISNFDLPFGSSVVAVAKKPGGTSSPGQNA